MPSTYRKVAFAGLDVWVNTVTGALLVDLSANLPACSGNFLASGQQTASAGAGVAMSAVAGVKKVVISPRFNADGSAANANVVYIRHDAANTAAGIPVLPTDGKLVIYITDMTKLFVKTLTSGDGINWAAFD